MKALIAVLALQGALPGIGGERENLILHDLGHSVTAVAVAEGLQLIGLERTESYLLATVGLPVIQELYDAARWGWGEPALDFVTYQGAWAVPLAQDGHYAAAVGVAANTTAFVYRRHTTVLADDFRNSPAFHGVAIAGAMVVTGLFTQDSGAVIWAYLVLNTMLTVRELIQLANGNGEWADIASGWLIPLPLVLIAMDW